MRKAEYSFTAVRRDARSFSVAANWAFWVSSSFPSSCLLPFLLSFLSPSFMQFFLLVQQGGTDGHVLRLWPHAQKRGLQEAADGRDPAGGKAAGGVSADTARCPWGLCFVGW